MNCKDMNKLFTAYLDDEVTLGEREQIQTHLSTCPHCREELEALAATQSRLRQALKVMAAGVTSSAQAWAGLRQRLEAEERSRVTILDLAKSKVKGGIDTMIRGLVSRQPVWKTAVVSTLALALVIGLSLTMPSLSTKAVYAKVADIAQNSSEVQAALGDEEVEVVAIEIVDGKGTIIYEGTGRIVTVEVNLKAKEVTEVEVAIKIVDMQELSEADKREAIDIARADPRVKELLDQGATISGEVLPTYSLGMMTDTETGKTLEISGTIAGVQVQIELGEKSWIARVDLTEGKVVELIEMPSMPSWESSGPVKQFKLGDLDVDEEGHVALHIGNGVIEENTHPVGTFKLGDLDVDEEGRINLNLDIEKETDTR